jgi:mannose-6-phosphate isomerase
MERVWGGRELERLYRRTLPDPILPFGESWEIVDRDDEQSIVQNGPRAGSSLHDLWSHHREEIFGSGLPDSARFPILIKVLDARDDLSLQVHPPAALAARLGGEPKTEMWFIAAADRDAKLYVGLKSGVHAITPETGDSIFIPSGRLHAIGAGFLIHEIQQNSDTTYRVFDWNRLGLDGRPRQLHVADSLASIDFNDFEPAMDVPDGNTLAACEYFITDHLCLQPEQEISNGITDRFSILSVVEGELKSAAGTLYPKGRFLLLPRNAKPLEATKPSSVLQITLPR